MKFRFYISFLASISSLTLQAQGGVTEFKIQAGHGFVFAANRVALSQDGKYAVSAGNNIKLWDVATGRELQTFAGTNALDISKDGKYLVAAVDDSVKGIQKSFSVWDVKTGQKLQSFSGHTNAITAVVFSPDASKIASTSSDQSVRVWDAANGSELLKIQAHKIWVTCVAFSPDGKFLASGGGDKAVKIWDMATGKQINVSKKYAQTIRSVAFSSDGQKVIASSSGDGGDPAVIVLSALTGKEITQYAGGSPAFFSTDAKFVFAQDFKDYSLMAIELATGKIIRKFSGHRDFIFDADASADGQLIISCSQDKTIKVWDVASGSELKMLTGFTKSINDLTFSPNDQYILALNGYNDVAVLDASILSIVNNLRVGLPVHFSKNQNNIFHRPGLRQNAIQAIDYFGAKTDSALVDEANFESIVSNADGSIQVTGHSQGFLKIWNKGKISQVIKLGQQSITKLVASASFNWVACPGENNSVQLVKIASGKLVHSFPEKEYGEISAITFSPDEKFVITGSSSGYIARWDLQTGQKNYRTLVNSTDGFTDLEFQSDGSQVIASTFGPDVYMLDPSTGKVTRKLEGHKASVFEVGYSHDKKFIISGSDDGEIKLWNAQTGAEVMAIIFIANSPGDFIGYTPDGYYMATREGTKAVHFIQDGKVYFFDQFDLQYNRPDILLERLGKAPQELIDSYRKAYEKRLKRINFSPDKFLKERTLEAPRVGIASTVRFTSTKDSVFTFQVQAEDKKTHLNRLHISVNGVPVYGLRGKEIVEKATHHSGEYSVHLSPGKNRIEVSAINENGVESLRDFVDVNYITSPSRPDLYLIGFGASSYADARMNLTYAAKDVRDFVKIFSSQKEKYGNIFVDTLLDSRADGMGLENLKSKLLKTRTNDQVFVFIAGHGLLDKNLDYYLATHHVDFNDPAKNGLAYEKLEELLDAIPARNKILLMDACHSGELDKEDISLTQNQSLKSGSIKFRAVPGTSVKKIGLDNSFELMKHLFSDLKKGNGTTVISSAGGAEYAMEGDQWNNGAFTFSLLYGMREMKADLNRDGKVMLSELQRYLQKQVYELTGGKQKPTSRMENILNDWQVW